MAYVRNEEELVNAINGKQSTIEFEVNFAKKIMKIKATGAVAWLLAASAISISVYASIMMIPATVASGGSAALVGASATAVSAGTAVAILGAAAATTAIRIGVKGKGMGVIKDLRDKYDILEQSDTKLILKRKN